MAFTGRLAAINAALEGMVFTPEAGFVGAASVRIVTTELGYRGFHAPRSDADTIDIAVEVTNHPPVAADDSGSTAEDSPVDLLVVANDSDPDGDALAGSRGGRR